MHKSNVLFNCPECQVLMQVCLESDSFRYKDGTLFNIVSAPEWVLVALASNETKPYCKKCDKVYEVKLSETAHEINGGFVECSNHLQNDF